MKTSIIILTFNNKRFTEACIESLYKYTPLNDFELILVDNNSNDGSKDWIKDFASKNSNVKYIINDFNNNFSGGCNQGAAIATCEYLLFLNNDTILTPNWLYPMQKCFLNDKKIGIVGNVHMFPNTNIVWHCGVVIDVDCSPHHIYFGHTKNTPMVNKSREFQVVTGACLMIRKDIFNKVGGFDENYKNSYEDVDLCFKVGQLGYKVYYCHESMIYHYGSISENRKLHDNRNAAILIKKWKKIIKTDRKSYMRKDNYPYCLFPKYPKDLFMAIKSIVSRLHYRLRNPT